MNIAFIPVRGGSKSIPLKNIKLINGKPLVYWTLKSANDAKCIDKVIIEANDLADALDELKAAIPKEVRNASQVLEEQKSIAENIMNLLS